ncbi:MAG: hypothetical protein IH968_17220 [Gemmatimonadetes bacterium]|nr:hypothetical protein [Gemmatimonadota bacterium]
MACIDENQRGIALVVDHENRVVDTLTDRDIRRAVLDGVDLSADVSVFRAREREDNACHEPVTAMVGAMPGELPELMRRRRVPQIHPGAGPDDPLCVGVHTSLPGRRMRIWRALPPFHDVLDPGDESAAAGSVLRSEGRTFSVRTGDGALSVVDWDLPDATLAVETFPVGAQLGRPLKKKEQLQGKPASVLS